jgi:5-methylcytosine-specific restriction endonuclease McrA
VPITLQERIQEFLPTLRLGVDFGEYTGGIALVRGNRILHAETFLDFHAANLEQRRQLRRGRRTRHAKTMRLARLRSWVLRQRLPNGRRLPDPYALMRDPKYMVQPGVYGSKGTQPDAATSWIDLARAGKASAAGFVRALTLLFQKRGYKWDAIALDQMNDAKLKDFLASARIPSEELAENIRAQINRRRLDPSDPARGRNKVSPEELERLLAEARTRQRQPRVAEHRDVKKDDLRAVVDGFGRTAGLSQENMAAWKSQLARLLDKALRLPRFDNRLKSGCSWCGKATPRKIKVRELAYWAAVNNLRVRRWPRPPRPLLDEEAKMLRDWWADRAKAPGLETIKRHLKKIGTQHEMARQFYDLLKNETPKGRTSLCAEHLAMAAQGMTMKDAGVEWQTVAVRKTPNPCRETRDARVLHRLEQVIFRPGETGQAAWRYGPVQHITLEIPEPQTERAVKGEQKPRQQDTLLDRLLAEFDGRCAYAVAGECSGEMDKDHIYPRSREGPDVRVNLVPACKGHNEAKGNRTPFEWLGSRPAQWEAFQQHVTSLAIPLRKKEILLNETGEYPAGSPTPLARVGARPRQFIVALRQLFSRRGVPPPRVDYHLGEPLVQRLQGRETERLRRSWLKSPDGADNFPIKDRNNLYNHAEDAALLAAAPPHTWREHIYAYRAVRPNWKGEWVEQGGLAMPALAPDWAGFMAERTRPLVRVLGHYPVTWKTSFADLTFGRSPQDVSATKLRISVPVKDLKVSLIPKVVSSYWRERLGALANELGLAGSKAIPKEKLEEVLPGLRRVQLERQPGGVLATVHPSDGPTRKLQIKPPSEGAVVWQTESAENKKAKTEISMIRPLPLRRLGFPRIDPPVPKQAKVLCRLRRHQIIWLDASAKHFAGFYRLTKFQKSSVTAVPENLLPREIALRENIKPAEVEPENDAGKRTGEITLGKAELLAYALSSRPVQPK